MSPTAITGRASRVNQPRCRATAAVAVSTRTAAAPTAIRIRRARRRRCTCATTRLLRRCAWLGLRDDRSARLHRRRLRSTRAFAARRPTSVSQRNSLSSRLDLRIRIRLELAAHECSVLADEPQRVGAIAARRRGPSRTRAQNVRSADHGPSAHATIPPPRRAHRPATPRLPTTTTPPMSLPRGVRVLPPPIARNPTRPAGRSRRGTDRARARPRVGDRRRQARRETPRRHSLSSPNRAIAPILRIG